MLDFKRMPVLIFILILVLPCVAQAAPNEYLKYQEPPPAASSSFSTFAYVISLIITFTVVIGLAYVTSRFLGRRMGTIRFAGDNQILLTFPLGQGKAVYVVEISGKYLVLGVTDHCVNLLQEITAPEEIEKLKSITPQPQPVRPFEQVFEKQLSSLQNLSQKFPAVFKQNTEQNEREGKR